MMKCANTIIQKGIVKTSTEVRPVSPWSRAKLERRTKSATCRKPSTIAMR
jgi:hypothetical protein